MFNDQCSMIKRKLPIPLIFFILTWVWASWWMGDVGRIARERSFFATDSTLMQFLWQQEFGSLWILGRALLTLFRWPLLGGGVVATMLAFGSWMLGYCLRLRPRWRWIQYLPAAAWMTWVAWSGFELYYQHESGRPLGTLLLGFVVVAIDGFIISTFSRKPLPEIVRPPKDETQRQNLYYAIALARTGRLTDDLFQIRLDYDSLYLRGRSNTPDNGTNYYLADCNYHAGLLRAAEHNAMEMLTMDGPSLYTLKHLTRLAILHSDFKLAQKYLDIISQMPFESAFVEKYEPMTAPTAAAAQLRESDPEFASIKMCEPVADCFESQFQEPTFLGYFAVLTAGRSLQALYQSLMANLYSKRMNDFLMRCQPLVGQVLPQSIGEGLITQSQKNPQILQAFPSLQMDAQRYRLFLQTVSPYIKDRAGNAQKLFQDYRGYYPYYYFFGNLKATRKSTAKDSPSKAGVN